MTAKKSSALLGIWALVALLIVVHQDNWLWENGTLVLGFIPIGLFFHACISIAASMTWFFAVTFAWPDDVDVLDEGSSGSHAHGVVADASETKTSEGEGAAQ